MTGREWQPGDVAAITDTHTGLAIEWYAHNDGKGWASLDPSIGWVADSDVQTARPLVVIDPEDSPMNEMRRLDLAGIRVYAEHARGRGVHTAGDLIDWLADQIEAQTRPPKPAEPTGLGAVVEDASGVRWVSAATDGQCRWVRVDSVARGSSWCYVNFEIVRAVRVLSEGVTA